MTKFKKGDRVNVYLGLEKLKGIIDQAVIDSSPSISVLLTRGIHGIHNAPSRIFHKKQCRRIEPKKLLREFWVNIYQDGGYCCYLTKDSADRSCGFLRTECIRVREIREKK